MINDLPFEVDRRLHSFVNAVMNGIAAGVEAAGDGDAVADVQRANRRFVNGRGDLYHRHAAMLSLLGCRAYDTTDTPLLLHWSN